MSSIGPKSNDPVQGLEAYFMRQVLSEVTKDLDSGFAGDTFKDMFNQTLADTMAKSGQVQLTPEISQELEKAPEKTSHVMPGPAALKKYQR